jgi:hypothetical protein
MLYLISAVFDQVPFLDIAGLSGLDAPGLDVRGLDGLGARTPDVPSSTR